MLLLLQRVSTVLPCQTHCAKADEAQYTGPHFNVSLTFTLCNPAVGDGIPAIQLYTFNEKIM
jgi:hypothetical protein